MCLLLVPHQVVHQPVNHGVVRPVMNPRQQTNSLLSRGAAERRISLPLRSGAGLKQLPDHLGRPLAFGNRQRQQRPILGAELLAQRIEFLVVGRLSPAGQRQRIEPQATIGKLGVVRPARAQLLLQVAQQGSELLFGHLEAVALSQRQHHAPVGAGPQHRFLGPRPIPQPARLRLHRKEASHAGTDGALHVIGAVAQERQQAG